MNELSRKQFLSLGVFGALGLLEACSLDDSASGPGAGGQAGSSATTSSSSATGGGTSATASGTGGNGGSSTTATTGGSGAGGAGGGGGKGGSGGSGVDGGGGTAGSGGSKDAGIDAPKFDAGACTMVVIAAISMNHNMVNNGPHYLRVPMADIVAGVDAVFQTESDPNAPANMAQSHSHFIKLTAADFAALRAGMTITKKACGHEHQFGLHCGSMAAVPAGTVCNATDSCGNTQDNTC